MGLRKISLFGLLLVGAVVVSAPNGNGLLAAEAKTPNDKAAKKIITEACVSIEHDIEQKPGYSETRIRGISRGEDNWWKIRAIINNVYDFALYNQRTKEVVCGESNWKKRGIKYRSIKGPISDDLFAIIVNENTKQYKIGKGKISLSPKLKSFYKMYLKERKKDKYKDRHSVLAVSSSTKSGGYRLLKNLERAKKLAVDNCNASAYKKKDSEDCAIYDIDGKVVWDFDADPDKSIPSVSSNTPSPNKSVEQKLINLKKLLEKGLITKDEAAEKRKAILDAM